MWESLKLILEHSTAYLFKVAKNTHLQCYFCPKLFEDPLEFRRHVDCLHSSVVDRACAINNRMSTRIDITNLLCRLCATSQDTLASMAEHLRDHHDLDVDPKVQMYLLPIELKQNSMICATCAKAFTSHPELTKHLNAHSVGLICHVCGKKFQTERGLKGHTMEHHSSAYSCRRCKKQFLTKKDRSQHVRETKECMMYVCSICEERFLFWELKEIHMVQVHKQEKTTFPCKECGLLFEKRIQLYFHVKEAHTQDLKCQVCGTTFGQKRELIEHGYSHTGERPFQCPHCDATFARAKNFAIHVKGHDDSKKLRCPGCSKLFVERKKIKYHVNKHHPEIFDEWAATMKFRTCTKRVN